MLAAFCASLVIAVFTSGCYLSHVAGGQLRLLWRRESAAALLAADATAPALREQLALVAELRGFARALGLDVGGQYTSLVDWPGDRVVTTVVATRPGEIAPAGFWFPIVGRLPYKGFFDPALAEAEASELRAQGYDVCISPIRAYSTLGWFADPLTTPLLALSRGRLIETLFHELVHATLFAPGDAKLSEGLATFIGQEASVRFLEGRGEAEAAERRRREVEDSRAVSAILESLRDSIGELYRSEPAGARAMAGRESLVAAARSALAELPLTTLDAAQLASRARTGDACLALAGAYAADLPRYDCALRAGAGELADFIAAWRRADAEGPSALREQRERIGRAACAAPARELRLPSPPALGTNPAALP
jgi:predicted aminopeptidase